MYIKAFIKGRKQNEVQFKGDKIIDHLIQKMNFSAHNINVII